MKFNQHALHRWANEMKAGKHDEARKTAEQQVECYRHAGIFNDESISIWKVLAQVATSNDIEAEDPADRLHREWINANDRND